MVAQSNLHRSRGSSSGKATGTAWTEHSRLRQTHANLCRDRAIVLNAAVAREVEDRLFTKTRGIEVAVVDQETVLLPVEFCYDFSVRVDDAGTAHQVVPVLDTSFRHGHNPG